MNDGVSVLVACPRSRVICVVAWMPIEDVDVDPAQNVTVKVRRLSVYREYALHVWLWLVSSTLVASCSSGEAPRHVSWVVAFMDYHNCSNLCSLIHIP